MTDEEALDHVLASVPPAQLVAKLAARANLTLAQAEKSKIHPMSKFSLPESEWADFKAHLLDGGGSLDHVAVGRDVYSALLSDNQDRFWSELTHFLKSAMKAKGVVQPTKPGEGVILNGISQTQQLNRQENKK